VSVLSRRRAESLEASAYRLTRLASFSLLGLGLVLAVPANWLLQGSIEHFLPQYRSSLELLVPMLLAATLRLSDFWSSLLIVIEREGLFLAGQLAAIVLTAIGLVSWLTAFDAELTPPSLAWLAFAAALLSHAASAAGVQAASRSRARSLSNAP